MAFVTNWLVPIIKLTFLGGIGAYIIFIISKAFNNAWKKQWKFVWKYKILRKKIPEKSLQWCFEAIEKDVDYYMIKKTLLFAGKPNKQINETLWIYAQLFNELNKEKGGIKHGRKHKGSDSKIKGKQENLPTI